jgi:3-hydroxyacyl-CoA dehydrogenase
MGAGIAYSCLNAGYRVHLLDNNEAGLERGRTTINKLFEGGIARSKISEEEMQQMLDRLTLSENYDDVSDADLIIEAVFENMAIKKEVFEKLDAVCKQGAILASNTSTLDIAACIFSAQPT